MSQTNFLFNILLIIVLLVTNITNINNHSFARIDTEMPGGLSLDNDKNFNKLDNPSRSALPEQVLTFIPIVSNSIQPLDIATTVLIPESGGQIELLRGKIIATFHPQAIQQITHVNLSATLHPSISTPGLGKSGPAIQLDLRDAANNTIRLPSLVLHSYSDMQVSSIVTPSVTLSFHYHDSDISGIDERTIGFYRKDPVTHLWKRIPSAVYPDRNLLIGHVEESGEYVPIGLLTNVLPQTRAARVALDPDDDDGFAVWPSRGRLREITFNVRLSEEVSTRLVRDGCVETPPLITRDTTPFVSNQLRVDAIQGYAADVAVTVAFNSLQGFPWGIESNGGPIAYARNLEDRSLAETLLEQIFVYTSRRSTRPVLPHTNLPREYREFERLNATYTHIETLFLDHIYDFQIIDTAFDRVADGVYAGIRRYLEGRGFGCAIRNGDGSEPQPPPYPPRPSPELIQRWRDLGSQFYQRYGGDPVSLSTGNYILSLPLARIPGRGGLDIDFTFTYNSQDQRSDLLGFGWNFPYNVRLQRFADDSVAVIHPDGRTFLYEWNGAAYQAPAGVYDKLERNNNGWTLTSYNKEWSWRFLETITGLGILTEWQDRRGNTITLSYDLSNQDAWRSGNQVPRPPLTRITDAVGRTIEVESDEQGRISSLVLPDGRRIDLRYDSRGDLVTIIDTNTPERGVYRFVYDERHRITRVIDPEGITQLINVYDDRDRVVEQVDANGFHSFLRYDPTTRTTLFIDNLGNRHYYIYDQNYRIIAETNPLNHTVRYEYDNNYNLIRVIDARGHVTTLRYDERGNLIERYDPLPSSNEVCADTFYTQDVVRWSYNADNRVTSYVDALGNRWNYEYDNEGNLIRSLTPNGVIEMSYDEWGQITSITDSEGRITRYEYDTFGNLITTINPQGGVQRSIFDITGRMVSLTDENNHTTRIVYNGNNKITQIIDPKGQISNFVYDRNNLLLQSINKLGFIHEFRYDNNYKVVGELDHQGGAWNIYEYDALQRLVTSTNRNGHTTSYQYDAAGQLKALIEPNGAVTNYDYDADGNLIRMQDAMGNTTVMTYDALGRLSTTTDALGNTFTYCYDAEDRIVAKIGPRQGERYTYSYDAFDQPVSITDPSGSTWYFEYDTAGNQIAEIDPLGHRTDYEYDSLDRLIAVLQPVLSDGRRPTTRLSYDAVGNLIGITSPRGFVTHLEYDQNDNLVLFVDPLGGRTTVSYDAEDRPVTLTNPNGSTTTIFYDPVGNPRTIVNDLGEKLHLFYDANYNLIRSVDPLGRETIYEYDEIGNLIRMTDAAGNVTNYQRDLLGRVTSVLDAEGRHTHYSYDEVGRLSAVIDPLQGITRYEYDRAGNLTRIIDANNQTTNFYYDLRNQLTGEIDPLGNVWSYFYDPVGRLTQRIDAMGRKTLYEYDSNHRLVRVLYENSNEEQTYITFNYDLDGNETQMCDHLGCFQHDYDALGRQVRTTDWLGRTVQRAYDAVGNLVGLRYPNGQSVRYTYDRVNRLSSITLPQGVTSFYQWDAADRIKTIQHPNNTKANYEYDVLGRLTDLEYWHERLNRLQNAYHYTLDRVGNRVSIREVRSAFNASTTSQTIERHYSYDALNRLTRAITSHGSDVTYRFDKVGNRIEYTGDALIPDPDMPELPIRPEPIFEQYSYNEANQLIQSRDTSFDYNANGNRRTAVRVLHDGQLETTTYTYDQENRLIGVERRVGDWLEMQASYSYDGYGRRVEKTVIYPDDPGRNQRITYLYDGLEIIGATIEEYGTTRELAFYLAPSPISGVRRAFAMEDLNSHEMYWFQTDGTDSIIAITDSTGNIVAPLLYDEYGKYLAGDTSFALFSFTAQHYDLESCLLHFHARIYDPATGTWLSADLYRGLIVFPTTLHRYGYVGSNPVSLIDEYGYFFNIAAAAVGAVAGAAINGTFSAVTQFAQKGRVDWKEVGVEALGGAVSGAICGVSAGIACVGGQMAVNAVTGISKDVLNGRPVQWNQVARGVVVDAALGIIPGSTSFKNKLAKDIKGQIQSYGVLKNMKINKDVKEGHELFQAHHILPKKIAKDLPKYTERWAKEEALSVFVSAGIAKKKLQTGPQKGYLHYYLHNRGDFKNARTPWDVARAYSKHGFYNLEKAAIEDALKLGASWLQFSGYIGIRVFGKHAISNLGRMTIPYLIYDVNRKNARW
ncbi:DUF6531 domain-containing protein [Chloroflexus sp. Y-396-1]|uniref:DUF6531 domain-containing protein n=1 Tax=Chloroflexus sp. Y-396-1 TaxID=867845 RepID=UPI00048A664A|nr:DUF6531 domain-containing protein [Chloroflexus sp. Y-396-1]